LSALKTLQKDYNFVEMTGGTPEVDKTNATPPHASFREVRAEYQRNGLTHVVYFTHATHVPNDVFAYGREAPNCFDQRRYLATITLASAMVEIILNKDGRLRTKAAAWRTLNMKLVRDAERKGLPVVHLLGVRESLRGASIEFVELRNRIAHGNLSGLVGFEHSGTTDYSSTAREVAFDHLRKAEEFLVNWYNTSPDVQQRKITNHRWPTL
jgi:hypothetical protein